MRNSHYLIPKILVFEGMFSKTIKQIIFLFRWAVDLGKESANQYIDHGGELVGDTVRGGLSHWYTA